jgi:hypothetical protein
MPANHPVTNDGQPDRRYTITKEFCGYPDARFVARFCGDFIGQSLFYSSAVAKAVGHNAARKGALVITEVPAHA